MLELALEIVELVGVGALGEQGALVVVLEGVEDGVGVVGEVEDQSAVLVGVGAVEPRQGLHRVDASELLVDVHGVEKRLIEAGLELLGDDQEAVGIGVEGGGGLALRHAVEAGLGVGLAVFGVGDSVGEGDQVLVGQPAFLQAVAEGEGVAHRVEA
ncbi:MAG: hypothetical protein V3T72_22755 [Thermoanaerobaculia bacterium]